MDIKVDAGRNEVDVLREDKLTERMKKYKDEMGHQNIHEQLGHEKDKLEKVSFTHLSVCC